MIGTVFHIAVLRLWNNKQELLLALVVPILFFSIFALIFGRGVGSGTPAIRVAIVDDDMSALTGRIIRLLKEQVTLQIGVRILRTNERWPLEVLTKKVLRDTDTDVVICLPAGMEQSLQRQTEIEVHLCSEGTNPVGRQIVSTMLAQVVAATLAKEQPSTASTGRPSRLPLTEANAGSVQAQPRPDSPATATRPAGDLISIKTTDVFGADKHNPKIAMYAAGIAVMFLLFSATGAGGSLLEEHEAGTLDRLLSSRLTVTQLLAGKWLYITCLGCVQLTVMFVWAQMAFDVDLLGHLPGFALMTLSTAAATASLALFLAVLCRSRAQLNGVAIVLILTMSALGGSMVPRYIMSEEMQRWGQFTFNAWALDGFKKVFWYDVPIQAIATEAQVLWSMTVALSCLARLFADRWAVD